MNVDYNIIGKRIKRARLKKGYSQENLADELDVSVAYLSRIETGKSQINLRRLIQVSEVLETKPEELLSGSYTNSEHYLDKELSEILIKCTPKGQQLIYKIAELVESLKLV